MLYVTLQDVLSLSVASATAVEVELENRKLKPGLHYLPAHMCKLATAAIMKHGPGIIVSVDAAAKRSREEAVDALQAGLAQLAKEAVDAAVAHFGRTTVDRN